MPPVNVQEKITRTARATSVAYRPLGWILLLSLVFFAARGNFSFQSAGGNDSLSRGNSLSGLVETRSMGVLGYVVIPGIAYSIVMWQLAINIKRILTLTFKMRILTFLAVLTILSAAWSQNSIRSAYNGLFYLLGTLFAFYLVIKFEPKQIMDLIMLTGTWVCILGIVLVVLPPHAGLYNLDVRTIGSWRGIFPDRTSAAKYLTYFLSPALVFGYGRFSWRRLAYILLVGTCIVMAQAVTALIIVLLYTGFMVMLYLSRRFERRTALVLGLVGIPVCTFVIVGGLPYLSDLLGFFGRDLTLTGRTGLWAGILQSIFKRPLFGYGFYAFWQGLTGESANLILANHWVFGYAHNGMLEILLQLGVVGLTVFLITYFQAIRNAWSCFPDRRSIGVEWYSGIMFLTLLYNVDEATVLFPNDLLSILYVVACAGLALAASTVPQKLPGHVNAPALADTVHA
jgi:exopolysaccharide production protein ExoQ